MRRGVLLLAGAGLVTEAVYVVTAFLLPWWRYGRTLDSWRRILTQGSTLPAAQADTRAFVGCLAGIAVLALAYLLGWLAVRYWKAPRWLVWAGGISFAAALFWLLPITADLFVYLSQAHLFTDWGMNPFLRAPSEVSGDSFLAAYRIVYTQRPSVYGPAWILLSAPGTLGRNDFMGGLLYLKGLAAAAYLGCVWLVERILRQVRPERAVEGAYLFAWNPLVVFAAVGDGHNDIVLMAFALLALWLLLRQQWAWAAAALTLSVWIKYTSLIFVPFFALYAVRAAAADSGAGPKTARPRGAWLRRGPGAAILQGTAAAVLVTAAAWLPFGRPTWLVGVVGRLLHPVNSGTGGSNLTTLALAAGLLCFIVILALLLWRGLREGLSTQRLLDAAFVAAALVFVFGAARSEPWHLIWPAALAGLASRRWVWIAVAGLAIILLAAQVWVEWGMPGLPALG